MRTALVAMILGLSLQAWAGAPGTMVLTSEPIDTNDANFEKDAKAKQVTTLTKSGDQWTLNFLAFLKKAAGSKEVQLVFYDEAEKKHEATNAFPIETQPSAKILVSSVSFNADQGFKAGHKYNVMVTRLIGGHEEVYARTTVSLK
ncbi:MAG TPA: hypothetical protein VGL86_15295 [Polyangia bacterium]|jgi:hypothetical protein